MPSPCRGLPGLAKVTAHLARFPRRRRAAAGKAANPHRARAIANCWLFRLTCGGSYRLQAGPRPRKLLTVVTKSNAQRHAMVMWDEIAAEVAVEFPDVTCRTDGAD